MSTGYDDLTLGLHLSGAGQVWVSAATRVGHIHGVTSVKPGGDLLVELSEHLYDFLDAIRFAEPLDTVPLSEVLGLIAFGQPEVRDLFHAARAAAGDRGRQLLVRIQASPQLAAMPWELLPDPNLALAGPGIRYLTLSPDVHVVRLSRGRTYSITNEPVEPPLNLLFVLSSPMGRGPGDDKLTFDLYEGKANLLAELTSLQDGGWLNIDVEDRPTMDNLRRRVRSKRRGYHVLHYLGHAQPDELILEDERGGARSVGGLELVEWLRTCPDLRLVTFTGCETARPPGDPSSLPGTDWTQLRSLSELAAQGSSPVVLGMQTVLPFRSERLMTRSLYQALASGNTVVDALRLARAAVRGDVPVGNELVDWAIPALFINTTEPAPVLERRGTPSPATRRRSNVAKLDPPAATAVRLIGRDVPLRQAVEVLCGRTRERVLIISGADRARASELLDRALDEVNGHVSDILSMSYGGLADATEAAASLVPSDGEPARELVIRANLCAATAQLLERGDGRARDRRSGWTLRRWWAWLAEDLADGRRAVIAVDRIDAQAAATGPLRILGQAWLAETFPLDASSSRASLDELEALVEHLRKLQWEDEPTAQVKLVQQFHAFLGQPEGDVLAREILAEEAEELFNRLLQASLHASGVALASSALPEPEPIHQANVVERARKELEAARSAVGAVCDMVTKLVRRAPACRVAVVVDDVPAGMLVEIGELLFPIRLGENTWPEMLRWIRRSLPALTRFGEDRLNSVWRRHLGSDANSWEELERQVRGGSPPPNTPGNAGNPDETGTAESDFDRLAALISARTAQRRTANAASDRAQRRRRDRPLVVATAAMFTAYGAPEPDHASFGAFHDRLSALAERHRVGGRVTTAGLDHADTDVDTLAVLLPVGPPTADPSRGFSYEEVIRWYDEVGAARPDLVLLDFGGSVEPPELAAARHRAFPAHRTLQIAAGGNGGGKDPIFPAWAEEVLAVGAIDDDGAIQEFSSRNGRKRKPDVFAVESFEPGDAGRGTSYSAGYVLLTAILAWTVLPELTPRGLRRFLVAASKPIDPKKSPRWPVALDCETVMVAARCERVEQTLRRGRASLQAIVAMTGLDWYLAQQTLDELVRLDRVATVALGRDYVYELVGGGRAAPPPPDSTAGAWGA